MAKLLPYHEWKPRKGLLQPFHGAGSNLAPVNSTPPTLTGTPQVGQTLIVSDGTWTNTPTSFARQLRRNGVDIIGATGATYTQVEADQGTMLSVAVTGINAAGSSAPNVSAAVGPVEAAAPAQSPPTLTGTTITFPTMTEGEAISSIDASGAFAGQSLTYATSDLPEGLAIAPSTGIVTGTPTTSGTYSTTFAAANSAGEVITDAITIQVATAGADVAPAIAALSPQNYGVGSGARYHNPNNLGLVTGSTPINFHMMPAVALCSIVDKGTGLYARRALVAGTPEPTSATQWLLDGSPISGQTGATINAQTLDLTGDLAARVTVTNEHGTANLTSAPVAVAFGATPAVEPVHLGTIMTTGGGLGTFQATNPSYSAGDLVVVALRSAQGASFPTSCATPNGERLNTALAVKDTGAVGSGGQQLSLHWYIAGTNKAQGLNIPYTSTRSDHHTVSVSVFDAGTFNTTTPIANVATSSAAGLTVSMPVTSPAITAKNASALPMVFAAIEIDQINGTPAGWTALGSADAGASCGYVGRRTALTTAGEAIPAANFTLPAARLWVAAACVINPGV